MSDVSDLHHRLTADGIDSGLMRRCKRCRKAMPIVGYDKAIGRMRFACRTPGCEPTAATVTSVMTVPITCMACGDPNDHQLAELSNGDGLVTCGGCATATVLTSEVSGGR